MPKHGPSKNKKSKARAAEAARQALTRPSTRILSDSPSSDKRREPSPTRRRRPLPLTQPSQPDVPDAHLAEEDQLPSNDVGYAVEGLLDNEDSQPSQTNPRFRREEKSDAESNPSTSEVTESYDLDAEHDTARGEHQSARVEHVDRAPVERRSAPVEHPSTRPPARVERGKGSRPALAAYSRVDKSLQLGLTIDDCTDGFLALPGYFVVTPFSHPHLFEALHLVDGERSWGSVLQVGHNALTEYNTFVRNDLRLRSDSHMTYHAAPFDARGRDAALEHVIAAICPLDMRLGDIPFTGAFYEQLPLFLLMRFANIVLDDKWDPSSYYSDTIIKRLILFDKEWQSRHHHDKPQAPPIRGVFPGDFDVQAIRDLLARRAQFTHPFNKTLQSGLDAGVPEVLKPWLPVASSAPVDTMLVEPSSSVQRGKRPVPMDTDEEQFPPQKRASPVRQ